MSHQREATLSGRFVKKGWPIAASTCPTSVSQYGSEHELSQMLVSFAIAAKMRRRPAEPFRKKAEYKVSESE
eukprot:8995902-Ditylum_brightwellii.AAC.1